MIIMIGKVITVIVRKVLNVYLFLYNLGEGKKGHLHRMVTLPPYI